MLARRRPTVALLDHLVTHGFRNLGPQTWAPGAGRHLILGRNGAGKTSLLEAVYAVATTRSFRTSQLADCVRHGNEGFRLQAEVARVQLELTWWPGQRQRRCQGKDVAVARYLEILPVVAWTAAEAEVLRGTPALGRRFLDRGLVAARPATLEALGRYRRALEQKRRLLAGETGGTLESWNRVLAPEAAVIVAARQRYTAALVTALTRVSECAGGGLPVPALEYRPSLRAALQGEETALQELARQAPRERARGIPLVGPHRDDLAFHLGGHELSRVASAGELKAVGLLVAAAQGEVMVAAGRRPLYLLDDADSELDPQRLAQVWKALEGEQVLVTSNRPAVWETLAREGSWTMEDGRLRPG